MPVLFCLPAKSANFRAKKSLFLHEKPQFLVKSRPESLVNCRIVSIFEGPRPCAMTICGQLARAKAATDL